MATLNTPLFHDFILRNFYKCSYSVKLCLFKSHRLDVLYNMTLWDRFHKSFLRRMESALNVQNCFLVLQEWTASLTNMFMELRFITFKTLISKFYDSNAKLKFNNRCVLCGSPYNKLGKLGKLIFHPGHFSIQIQTGTYLTAVEKAWFTKVRSRKFQTNIKSEYHWQNP